MSNAKFWRGLLAICIFLTLWEIGSRWESWFGFALPYVGLIPAPTAVALAATEVVTKIGYWMSWVDSFKRRDDRLPGGHGARHSLSAWPWR